MYKPHPQFWAQNLSKKVRLIHESLRYLAKYLAGDDGQAALAKKTRHDNALEAYQAAMEKYTRKRMQASYNLSWTDKVSQNSL